MGWLKLLTKDVATLTVENSRSYPLKDQEIAHIESIDVPSKTEAGENAGLFPFQQASVSDNDLPYINSDVVRAAKGRSDRLWLVIDQVVYDCTSFATEHPGGDTVIKSFQGEDCSWQFWRFHNEVHMDEFGRPLRIGRTSGVVNRFKERPRFVGLRKMHGNEDW